MSPTEIGHAAAYEAYRTWTHNSSIREPLSSDFERQREGFIGLAVAEGVLLNISSWDLPADPLCSCSLIELFFTANG